MRIETTAAIAATLLFAACGGAEDNNANNRDNHQNHDANNSNVVNNANNSNNANTSNNANNSNNANSNSNGATSSNNSNNTLPTDVDIELSFQALVNGGDFMCDGEYTLGTMDTPVVVSDVKFYVSEVFLIDGDGAEVPVALADDGAWQNGSVALLDFEDGTGNCMNGTAETRNIVEGTAPEGVYVGVKFTVGIPFDENHQDVAVAGSPLNLTSMFWNWQGGYKFIRVDGLANGSAGWRVHLGSTGCEMDANMEVTSCANPNRMEVMLADHDPATPIVFDIDTMMADTDMTPDVDDNSSICMSSLMHAPCVEIFDTLGLPFNGEGGTNDQSVFQ